MKLGVDLSIQDELDELHPVYTYHGEKIEPFSFFANHSGISVVRLRLWHNPYDEEGHPYGGGTNDLETFIRLAKRANNAGMDVLLDFHYSDFWVDPSRQIPPKAWKGLDYEGIKAALSQYTRETLLRLKKEGIRLAGSKSEMRFLTVWSFPSAFCGGSTPRKPVGDIKATAVSSKQATQLPKKSILKPKPCVT